MQFNAYTKFPRLRGDYRLLYVCCRYIDLQNCYLIVTTYISINKIIKYKSRYLFLIIIIFSLLQNTYMRNCHRLVLSAFSEHFETALSNTDNCPLVALDIDSAITGVMTGALQIILDFIYYGIVRTTVNMTGSLIIAGRSLGVTKFCDLLIGFENFTAQPEVHTYKSMYNI